MSGSVYFVECTGRIKVGFSRNPKRRMSDLATSAPGPLTLIATIDGTFQLERAIHKQISAHRVSREWFDDCAVVRETISDLIARGPAAIGFVDAPRPAVSHPSSVHREVTNLFKTTLSHGESAAVELSKTLGVTKQIADKRLYNQSRYSAEEVQTLLQSDRGFDFLNMLMDGQQPDWWRRSRAARRAAAAAVKRSRGAA